MPRTQEGLARLVEHDGVTDRAVIDAFRDVDRSMFVPPGNEKNAYGDHPVSLPEGQTTSQPSLIARMIEAVRPSLDRVVLEIGSGYGFQTALLARLFKQVVSIERWESLADGARANLARAGIDNATVIVGDGYNGEPGRAPYDAIVVSAAANELPRPLAEQLAEGGRMVIPLRAGRGEDVTLYIKKGGALNRAGVLTPARFVPLVRDVARARPR